MIAPMRGFAVVVIFAAGCGGGTIGDPPIEQQADARPPAPDAIPAVDLPDAHPCTGGDARMTDPDTGICYVYVAAITTWSLAQADCVARGGTLVVPTSSIEVALAAELPTTPLTLPDAWIGGTDAAVEGTFTWVTGEALAYTNWRAGEPNNGGTSGTQEDCVALEADTAGTWDDRPCGREYPYICELP